jgi:ubiquinone/menaquinone biosynthesis C-methylase UbiE
MKVRKKEKPSANVFDTYSRYYDLLYKDKDYTAESKYINNLLKQFNMRGKRILELGSGTGKHANILTKYGYEIVGIERSAEMVSKAKQDKKFRCVIGDITKINLNKKFDAALSLFH